MTKTAAIIASALSIFALFYSGFQPEAATEIPQAPWLSTECTKQLEV